MQRPSSAASPAPALSPSPTPRSTPRSPSSPSTTGPTPPPASPKCAGSPAAGIVTWDVDLFASSFWFTRDYLQSVGPTEHRHADAALVAAQLDHAEVRPLLVPHDCIDGFFAAYWRRPEAYLDPAVRASISGLAIRDQRELNPVLARLEADLASGAWHAKYADLLDRDEYDLGYRLVIELERALCQLDPPW